MMKSLPGLKPNERNVKPKEKNIKFNMTLFAKSLTSLKNSFKTKNKFT